MRVTEDSANEGGPWKPGQRIASEVPERYPLGQQPQALYIQRSESHMFRYDRLIFILLATGCSAGADRVSTRDSTAAMTTGAAEPDSAASAAGDTATSAAAPAETTTAPKSQSVTVGQAPKPRVRPSIDPGRKSPTTGSSTAKAAPREADSTATPASALSSSQDQNLKYDAKTNTVTFQLIGGPSGFQFNGYSSGGATLTLPPKANVVMNFINKDGTPHSAEVVSGEGPLPNSGGDAAIPRAYTNQLIQGLPQEGTDVMQFTVPASGSFRIFCGVPGHGLSGMWIWMKIDPSAKTPSFGPTKA